MFKSKWLISLISSLMTLASIGTVQVVTNPVQTSDWIARNITGPITREAGEDGALGVFSNLIDSTVAVDGAPQSSEPAEVVDAQSSATGEADEAAGADPYFQAAPGTAAPLDATASASIAAYTEATGGTAARTTLSGSTAVDSTASASVPSYSGTTSGSTTIARTASAGSTTVDTTASASITSHSSTTSSPTTTTKTTATGTTSVDTIASASQKAGSATLSTEGMINLDQAVAIALKQAPGAAYAGFELDDEYPPVYNIFLVSGSTGYEIEIHAVTGAVLEIETSTVGSDSEQSDDRDDESDDGGDNHEEEHEHESDEVED